jgi:Fe-S cluster assembly iron-binding protein IscA
VWAVDGPWLARTEPRVIAITERAATELEQLLATSSAPPQHGIKLIPDGKGGIGMAILGPNEGDEVIRRGDAILLIVDRAITAQLDGVELDLDPAEVADRPDGQAQFTFRPSAAGPHLAPGPAANVGPLGTSPRR